MNRIQFLIITIFTFIAITTWVVADIIFNTQASIPPNPKLATLLEDLNPSFNEKALEEIAKKDDPLPLIPLQEIQQKNLIPESTSSTRETTGSARIAP